MSDQNQISFFRKYKWQCLWIVFGILVLALCILAFCFREEVWRPDVLQTIAVVSGFYLTVIVFLYSKEDSDRQFKEHIEHLQKLTIDQIAAVQNSSEEQIKTLQELNNSQIEALSQSTERQIQSLNELTERQIQAMRQSTDDQIFSFEKQTIEIADRLTDSSVLLAEILGRQLEDSIRDNAIAIGRETRRMKDLKKWKPLRTNQEREAQLKRQWARISQLKKMQNYLTDKYHQIREFLGFSQDQIEETY